MNHLLHKKPKGLKAGFTILEILVTLGILAIILAIAYPVFNRYLPSARSRAAARELDSVMQKARLRAAINQRPVRVVINCERIPTVSKSCRVIFQTAVYTGTAVTSWVDSPSDLRVLHEKIEFVNGLPGNTFPPDGDKSYPNIYWAIFMPNSQVFSDPRPFDVFLYYSGRSGPDTPGWRIVLNNVSGRVNTERASMTID
jgi:prepilin-type N-terminal cleavage/methylation domain-containing protein